LSVQYAVEAAGVPTRAKIRRWVKEVVTQEAEITLRLVDEEEGQMLNRDYRGKDYATNVLTFVYDDLPHLAGDIVICPAVVEREAQQQDKSLEAHYAHLVVHGVLHLHGYDHEDEAEAREMAQGSFLENADVVRVSSLTGEGIPELKKAIEKLAAVLDERKGEAPFRLPVDRSFSVAGFGTVETFSFDLDVAYSHDAWRGRVRWPGRGTSG